MPQYTSTQTTTKGLVVNAVFDTETNQITYTVTTPDGKTATNTQSASLSGNLGTNSGALSNQLSAAGFAGNPGNINNTLALAGQDVNAQARQAQAVSTVTGNPPPAEKQAIPVPAADNPNPTPAPPVTTIEPQVNEQIAVSLPGGTMVFANQAALDAYRAGGAGALIQQQLPGGTVYKVAPVETVENPAPQTTVNEFGQVVSVENAAPEATTTYFENNGTTGNETYYPQLTAEEQALAFQGDAGAGPGENSYQAPPPDDTVYYENNGATSTSTPFPQLTPEELALAAQGDAGAGPGEFSYPPSGSNNSLPGLVKDTQSKATQADANNLQQDRDWRVKLSLAKGGKYLYNVDNPGILKPLQATNGVIFPYTPQINVTYAANYDTTELIHSNYKIFQYKGSAVDQISITCDFTAQDTFEADYLLAVIHFFRSVTKMFYGQDKKPNIGSPPPLCYLSGLGAFQFNNHPLAVTSFNYSLPSDVDYIRATNTTTVPGVNKSPEKVPNNSESVQSARIASAGLNEKQPNFQWPLSGSVEPTYVPTKMTIQISAYPIVARNDISNRFSLADYATGSLLRGKQNSTGGIW